MAPRNATQPHIFQRYHSALQVGRVLTAKCQRHEPVLVHFRQSEMDGACAHHALASALVILGLVKRSAVLDQSRRRYGVAALLYTVLADHWMDGIYAPELVGAIEQLNLPLAVKWADGFDTGVVDTLLVLDPSMDPLPFSVCNGQLKTAKLIDFKSRRTSVRWSYESVEGTEPVRLMSAISLTVRPNPPSKRRH